MQSILKFTLLIILLIPKPATAESSRQVVQALKSQQLAISNLLVKTYHVDKPGAAVVVVRDNKVLFSQGYGLANVEQGTAITSTTSIGLGSVSKQFTAAGLLLLVQQDKLDLDAKVSRYLPDMPERFAGATLRQILSHTSGYPDFFSNPEWYKKVNDPITPKGMIELMSSLQPLFEPGSRWQYSNFNYMVLAAVIESTSGLSFADYMQQAIFDPLQLNNSTLDEHDKIIKGRATGYESNGTHVSNAHYMHASHFSAAGALMSSAKDMARWHQIFNAGEFIQAELVKQAYTPIKLSDGSSHGYGFGWNMANFLDEEIIWHSGSGIGYESTVIQLPGQSNMMVAVLNNSPFIANSTDIARRVVAIMLDKPIPVFKPVMLTSNQLKGVQGLYHLSDGEKLEIRIIDKLMQYRFAGSSWRAFLASQQDLFYREDTLNHFAIKRDEQGGVIAIKFTYADQQKVSGKRVSNQVEMPPAKVAYNPDVIKTLVGKYDLGAGNLIQLHWQNDTLLLQIGPQQKVALAAAADYQYFSVEADIKVSFERPENAPLVINVQQNYPYRAVKMK